MNEQNKIDKKFNSIKKKTFSSLMKFNISLEEIEKDYEIYAVKSRTKQELLDFVWFEFNKLIERNSNDFFMQYRIYCEMVHFTVDYENAEDVNKLKELAMKAFKMHNKNTFKTPGYLTEAVIVANPKGCSVCLKDDGKTLNEEEFFKMNFLPHLNCTCEKYGCNCTIGFRGVRDSEGRLAWVETPVLRSIQTNTNKISYSSPKYEEPNFLFKLFGIFKKKK